MRVAHLLKHFEPGGIEKWLVDLTAVNHKCGHKLQMDFIMQTTDEAFFDVDIVQNGGNLIKLDYLHLGLFRYLYSLYKIFKSNKYDVVHSHFYHFSGLILFVAWLAGIKVRVSHCHNDKSIQNKESKLFKKLYLTVCVILNEIFSNKKIAVSQQAADSLFLKNSNVAIIPCGLIFSNDHVMPQDLIKNNGEIVLLNVGSYSFQKNHDYILKLAKKLKECGVKFKVYLIGAGEGWEILEKQSLEMDISDSVIFLGKRKDVHAIMKYIADFFIFPSRFEGLGLAAIESQYYGVRTLVSDTLPNDLNVSNYIKRLPIDDLSIDLWIEQVKNPITISENDIQACQQRILSSNFSVEINLSSILSVYGFER
ncbi:TPA: glycosyltransferase [Vibrio cholerae]|uniref:glycosyltransferase n=1 Tax=Vibrio cholerae TaxID=666 RepID=UPI0002C17976|nr:glycosyltransferase [Vibrio cholerae]EMQ71469.1 glycosyl transferases group 1 family protein [Vibrio cholerae O1 str. NHCC-008D]